MACAFDITSSPKACWSFPCVMVALSPSFTQKEKMAYRCAMFRASFTKEVHKHLLTCQAPTPHWGIAQPCHCKWGQRKDEGQRLSVLADYVINSTATRKLVSLLYCRTLYVPLNRILSENSRLEFALNSNVSETRIASIFRSDVGDDKESLLHVSVTRFVMIPFLNLTMVKQPRSESRIFNAVLVVQVPSEGITAFIHRESFKSFFEKLCVHMFTE